MKASSLLSIALSFALCDAALAHDASERPRVEARLVSPSSDAQRWYGVGDLLSRVNLCVTSNTGRFQLRLSPSGGGIGLSDLRSLEVTYVAPTGERERRIWDGQRELNFAGRTVAAECGVGGNVSLEIRVKQDSLTAAVAGDYFKQIQYVVDPA